MKPNHPQKPSRSLALAGALLFASQAFAAAPAAEPVALGGEVSSTAERRMEGVLVSAQRTGWPITISVVSDAGGRYQFPRAKLGAGTYAIRIRAVGYDPEKPLAVKIRNGKSARLDIRLRKTRDLAAQLTNAEWMSSMPGTPQNKTALLSCVNCHTCLLYTSPSPRD